ncbi:MAG: hypothetical protein SGILL_003059 [Bacillariaceae sp.]
MEQFPPVAAAAAAAAAVDTGSRSRRSSPERYNPRDVFSSNNSFSEDLFMPGQQRHHPDSTPPWYRFAHSRSSSHGALDQFNASLTPHGGHEALNPFATPDPHQNYPGYNFYGLQSFDGNEYFGPSTNQHPYSFHPSQYQYQQPPPNGEAPSNNAGAVSLGKISYFESNWMNGAHAHYSLFLPQACESMDERKPAAVDTSRPNQHPEHGPNQRSYPTQERSCNVKAPPYASLPSQDPPSEPSKQELAVSKRRSTRARRNPEAPTQGGSQQVSKRSSKKKTSVKKGPGTNAKPSRRNQSDVVSIRLHPTEQELEEARTPRKRQALHTWFERLRDLLEYKQRFGHSK